MSDKIPTPQNQSEEVDLGKLFQIIGNGFKNLFHAIGNFFKSIFHYLILMLIFFKKNIIIIGGATIIGVIAGYLLESNKPIEYTSNMIVDTNYGSGHRLYKQVDLLNNLIKDGDVTSLSKIFNIDTLKASKLDLFMVEPYEKDKNLVKEYDDYLKKTDTIFTRNFTIDNFKTRMNDTDFKEQNITAYASDKKIFNKLGKGIIDLTKNDFYNKRHDAEVLALTNKKNLIEKDLKVIDSLRTLYKKTALLSAKNDASPSTNIDLGAKQMTKNKDIELLDKDIDLIQRLNAVTNNLVDNDYVIAKISDFNDGEVYYSIPDSKWFKYGFLAFAFSILAILVLKLNTYLSNYEK